MMLSEIWQRKHVLMWRIYEQAPFFTRSPMMVPFFIGFPMVITGADDG